MIAMEERVSFLSGPVFAGLLKAVLEKNASFKFRAKGFSMLPCIRDGDCITVSPFSETPPRYGDVVAFVKPEEGNIIVHRIVGRKKGLYAIKGDCVSSPDGFFPRGEILGRVTRIERDGKRVYFGLGPERSVFALLNQKGSFFSFLNFIWKLIRPIVYKFVK